MPCTITPTKFASGGMNVLLEAVFEDNQIWICRIGYLQSKYGAKFLEKMIDTTVTAMRYVSKHTTIKVPEVYAYEGNIKTSPIGAVYMLLEPVSGISSTDMLNMPDFQLDKKRIDAQVASIMTQMSSLTFPAIGWLYETTNGIQVGPIFDLSGTPHGPFTTSADYFCWRAKQAPAEQQIWKAQSTDAALKSDFLCWLFEQAAPLLTERNDGPFPLMHPDLGGSQLLMDMDYNINGVIDWDETCTVPWLEFCSYPSTLKVLPYHLERAEYWPGVLERLIERQEHYRSELRRAGLSDWAVQFVGSQATQVADCLVHFISGRYKMEGRVIFKFLFGDIDFDEFRSDRSKWLN